jgi:hypothetical protein
MVKSLAEVPQADGTFKWELVELKEKQPASAPEQPARKSRMTKSAETTVDTEI